MLAWYSHQTPSTTREDLVLSQIIRAGRLDRSFFTSLLFDDYAVGNAVALVALLAAIPALLGSDLSVVAAVSAALYGLMWAGLTAVAAWAVATRILQRDGRIPTTFRLTAFAHVALIPTIFIPLFPGLLVVLIVGSLHGSSWPCASSRMFSSTWSAKTRSRWPAPPSPSASSFC